MEVIEGIVLCVVFGLIALFFRTWKEDLWYERLQDLRDHTDEWKDRYEW